MARTVLVFAYSGAAFEGYARQPDARLRTVEGALISALSEAKIAADAEGARLRSGSRTDRGVSARRNVATFESALEPEDVAPALGTKIPGLWPLSSGPAAEGFDPRKASWREYRYFLAPRDVPAGTSRHDLDAAFRPFVGRHDFSAFARVEAGRDPTRTVLGVDVEPGPDGLIAVRVQGQAFLWQQVRRMVAAALAVVRKEATTDEIAMFLTDAAKARDLGVAPAHPLVLWDVAYPGGLPVPTKSHAARLAARLEGRWHATAVSSRIESALLADLGRRLPGD